MADFRFEGPPTLIVALGRVVEFGDVVSDGPDALRHSAGFHEVEQAPKPKAKPAAGGDD